MAHEITSTDGLVLAQNAAWHGLGTVVEEAPSPREALTLAGLDWTVEQWPMYATAGEPDANGQVVRIPTNRFANVRTDTKTILGNVGEAWTPFQNHELADFCGALAEQGDQVKIESAGSIRGGEKVWFLMRGESFTCDRGDLDVVHPYILVSNGFDCKTGFRCTPTSVRVVCSNTLHAVLPEAEGGRAKKSEAASFVCRHAGNLLTRVEEAKEALRLYQYAHAKQRDQIRTLAEADVKSADVQQFFLDVYQSQIKPIPTKDCKTRERAVEAVASMSARFEREADQFGASKWVMLNAFTGWLQNDRAVRGSDATAKADSRNHSRLFGQDNTRSLAALDMVLAS